MVNRRNTVYFTIPEDLNPGKTKEMKANISLGIVVPKELEKKAQKFMDDISDDFSKAFKKWCKKQVEKLRDE